MEYLVHKTLQTYWDALVHYNLQDKDVLDFKQALSLFEEAYATYKKIKNGELADQTEQNIKILENMAEV